MIKHILILSTETSFVETISALLAQEGYQSAAAQDHRSAFLFTKQYPDLILLDLHVPNINGFEILREMKANPQTTMIPVIALSSKNSESDEIVSLEIGADDYLAKPIHPRKLIARIRALFRQQDELRNRKQNIEILTYNDLTINIPNYLVSYNKTSLTFPRKEFDILVLLALHPDKVFTRKEIAQAVWGSIDYSLSRIIDVHIGRIRKKLDPFAPAIETVPGIGYKFHV